MLNQARISIRSGNGGNGAVSGRREKFVPHGGPDGGDGGNGGSVFLTCEPNESTLTRFQYTRSFAAKNGGHGLPKRRHGKKGEDVFVPVPQGTEAWMENGDTRRLADLTDPGQTVSVVEGGKGGKGNARFATSRTQFPLIAEAGEQGRELTIRLELKLLADVAIIGAPNAGKSSLLDAVTAARPLIAEYPFSTLEPGLGVCEHKARSFVMVDVPGLLEGAHAGVGLGHEFLRHIERTRVLVHVVDGSGEDPLGAYAQVREEMRQFSASLTSRTEIVAVNKTDISGVKEKCGGIASRLSSEAREVRCISAASRDGLEGLLDEVVRLLGDERGHDEARTVPSESLPVIRPRPVDRDGVSVRKGRGVYVVSSGAASRLAAMVDAGNWEAKVQLYNQFGRLGVLTALETAGIRPGDRFKVGKMEWKWG